MCYSADGPYREIYHRTGPSANISFYIADPADQYWLHTFSNIAAQMKSAGVDGLYIDQLASYFPQPCFGRAGGDAAGSGWADGGRKLFSGVAEVLGPDAAVFSESNAEAYLADLHGNMALYGWQRCGFVPAFQAVYQGWTVNAGILEWPVPNKSDTTLKTWSTNKPGQNESSDLPSWMAYSALQLVYGHIPGAMMTEDLLFVLENSAEALALWRDMMGLRAEARDFLVFGQMLRPPVATVPLRSVPMCGNKPLESYPCCPVPEVVASVFKAKNGSVALIVANIATEAVDYTATADLGGGKRVNVSVSMPPTSARAVLLPGADVPVSTSVKSDDVAGASCAEIPAANAAVTLWPCSEALEASGAWVFPAAGSAGHALLDADHSLCLDVVCTMTPCIGGGDGKLLWWGAGLVVAPCGLNSTTFEVFRNGSIGASKPGSLPGGLCLDSTEFSYGSSSERAVHATPCSASLNQQWRIHSKRLSANGGPSDGLCGTACANPPPDEKSFCPRFHTIHDPGVADPCGPLRDESGLWHMWDDDGSWSHWTSRDLAHWDGDFSSGTNFSGATGSVSPTPSGVFAHWPIIAPGDAVCCSHIGSAKALDETLTRWDQRGPAIAQPARIDSGFRDPSRAFEWQGRWFVGVGCGSAEAGAQFCLFEASDDTLTDFTDRGSLFTTQETFGFMGANNVWQPANVTAVMLECPDLFRLGDKWVLIGSLYNQPNVKYTNQ